MSDLFNADVSPAIISRIRSLSPSSQPLWGKMSVSQMLAHCKVTMQVAVGEKKLKRNFAGVLFGAIAKKKMMGEGYFPQNLPTDKSFKMTDEKNFEVEKNELITLVDRFIRGGPAGLTKEAHPFFGKMTAEEWSRLSYKHLDHHLRQFGV